MKSKKTLIIPICICFSLIVISSIYLFRLTSIDKTQDESINNNEENIEDDENSILSKETINDLKENLGKGTNGDISEINESVNEKGEKQYRYTFTDGTTQTITIRNAEDVDNVEETIIDEEDDVEDQQDEDVQDEDEQDETEQIPEESPSTVYERYLNMSRYEKYAFYNSFATHQEYADWYDAAKAEYMKLHPNIEVGENQVIDFSDN